MCIVVPVMYIVVPVMCIVVPVMCIVVPVMCIVVPVMCIVLAKPENFELLVLYYNESNHQHDLGVIFIATGIVNEL